MPKVSVILPTYNCEQFINDTIDSILDQTFEDFELLIIDDCSTDNTVLKIKKYLDHRIKLHIKEKNTGYTNSLNWGVKEARGKYIARMDADDICYPERFEKQILFLDKNVLVDMLGTTARILGTDTYLKYPSAHERVKANLLFGSSLVHPSVMGRKKVFERFPYDVTKEPAEDYDLWTRVALQGKLANLEEPLLYYRVHPGQISNRKRKKQEASAKQSMLRMFKLLDSEFNITDAEIISYVWPQEYMTISEIQRGCNWYKSLSDSSNHFEPLSLARALSRKRYNLLKFYTEHNDFTDKPRFVHLELVKQFPILGIKFFFKKHI